MYILAKEETARGTGTSAAPCRVQSISIWMIPGAPARPDEHGAAVQSSWPSHTVTMTTMPHNGKAYSRKDCRYIVDQRRLGLVDHRVM